MSEILSDGRAPIRSLEGMGVNASRRGDAGGQSKRPVSGDAAFTRPDGYAFINTVVASGLEMVGSDDDANWGNRVSRSGQYKRKTRQRDPVHHESNIRAVVLYATYIATMGISVFTLVRFLGAYWLGH